jgi:CheY-like chemotaxis protein
VTAIRLGEASLRRIEIERGDLGKSVSSHPQLRMNSKPIPNAPLVLVVDDDEALLEIVRITLSSEGFRVGTARNGVEGLKAYDAAKPDLVITDLVMPEAEGIETILALRRRDPQVRIIAMSGGSSVGPAGFLRIAQGAGALYRLS